MSGLRPVLTIDGPSGAGKGTISRAVAKNLGWHYLDSGAIYRALAVAVTESHVSLGDEAAVTEVARHLDLKFEFDPKIAVLLSGANILEKIQSETCGSHASQIAAMNGVRKVLLQKQRNFRQPPGLVADGRDMGTIVFPDAEFKIFLTASAQVRAERRVKQLKEKGMNVNLEQITTNILERDLRDKTRETAPLVQAEGAILIDSSKMTIDQVVERVINAVCGL